MMPDTPTVSELDETAVVGSDALPEIPAVVVVVVTHDAGPWFEECLTSIAEQDYPNLSVLVIDTAGSTEALPRVAEVMPSAYVRRLDTNPGFGAAINEVLSMVEGAPFLLLCHDDILLEPNVVGLLVEEAFRSNAGVVGPKMVSWGAPDRLLQVGLSVDKTGVTSSHVDRGELDQEQHDAVRDVFVVPGGCTLVRADLFHTLGGYDPAIDFLGEDLDLCWRAHVAGARVLVVPDARVQHQEALSSRRPVDDRRQLQARHRLRTMLSVYGFVHLLRVLPQAVLFTVIEVLYSLITGHPAQAVDVIGAWGWNLRRMGDLRRRRREIQATRVLDDHEVRRLQVRGSARLLGFVRGELGRANPARAIEEARQEFAELQETLADRKSRVVPLAIGTTSLVLLVAGRQLFMGTWPEFGSIGGFDASVLKLLGDYVRGWQSVGFDAQSPAPTATAIIGLLGILSVGAMGVLQHLLVLGSIPLGLAGIWRLSAAFDSKQARAVTFVAYAVVPLPFNALANGNLGALVLYAAAPWILRRLMSASASPPWNEAPSDSHELGAPWRPVFSLGLILAIVVAFAPMVLLLFVVLACVLALSGALAGSSKEGRAPRPGGSQPFLTLVGGASGVAVALNAPWLVGIVVAGPSWESFAGVVPLGPSGTSMTEIFGFGVGPHQSVLGLGLVFAALLAILIGREWRFRAAVQAWGLIVSCWALTLISARDLLPIPFPGPDVLLSFGGAALAFAIGLGMVAFEQDLRRERFGWRQAVSMFAAAGVGLGALPMLDAAVDGRMKVPEVGLDRTLGFLDDEAKATPGFRVLWMGDPQVLPMAGYPFVGDVAFGVSAEGFPELSDHWQMPMGKASDDIHQAIEAAANGQTDRLGQIVAPLGVRYVVLVERAAPERTNTSRQVLPRNLARSVARQLDFSRIDIDPAVILYENKAWQAGKVTTQPESPRQWWYLLAVLAQLVLWLVVLRAALTRAVMKRHSNIRHEVMS
ncbi:MAG: glycosyltransferase [Acidimicrobiales bacterium]